MSGSPGYVEMYTLFKATRSPRSVRLSCVATTMIDWLHAERCPQQRLILGNSQSQEVIEKARFLTIIWFPCFAVSTVRFRFDGER